MEYIYYINKFNGQAEQNKFILNILNLKKKMVILLKLVQTI